MIMNLASEPNDLLWKNMGGNRGLFLFRRVFFYFLGLFIIIFISTPTAMLSTLKKADIFGIFNFEWAESLPFGSFLKVHLPPLIILTINLILLFLIDIGSQIENYEAHSLY